MHVASFESTNSIQQDTLTDAQAEKQDEKGVPSNNLEEDIPATLAVKSMRP